MFLYRVFCLGKCFFVPKYDIELSDGLPRPSNSYATYDSQNSQLSQQQRRAAERGARELGSPTRRRHTIPSQHHLPLTPLSLQRNATPRQLSPPREQQRSATRTDVPEPVQRIRRQPGTPEFLPTPPETVCFLIGFFSIYYLTVHIILSNRLL